MNCPNCKTEMEKGFVAAHGNYWKKYTNSLFHKVFFTGPITIWHYRCPKCGKIELYTDIKKNNL